MDQTPTKPRPSRLPGPDGILRSKDAEDIINQLAVGAFTSVAGREFLTYLRSITVLSVCGPEISDAGLRHREGMRNLVAIIEQRIAQGTTPHEHPEPEPEPKRAARTARAGR